MSQSYDRSFIEDFSRWREFLASTWAWIFHKFTGWVLVDYLFTHIAVLSAALSGAAAYTNAIQAFRSLLVVRILKVGLLVVVVFHILNRLRLLFVDLDAGPETQDKSFYASLILTGATVVADASTFLSGVSI